MIGKILVVLVCVCRLTLLHASVIGIDFGSDAFKVSIIQPGSPLDIVTNFQSKRKTPMSISFYRGERMFGSDSIALMARKPELTFSKIYRLLGRTPDHPHAKELSQQYFPYEVYANETTGFTCMKQEDTFYTPEELVAMMMQHIKDMTQNFGGKAIKDCVITVPSYFTYHERRALYVAADIAELRVLSLMEENTAAALHYGMDRVFDSPNTVLFYNMGASSLQVTIVTYSSYLVKEGGKNKTIGQFDVVGKGWDSSLGSFNFDVRLAELMAKRFNEIWGKKTSGKGLDLRNFSRPMTRLRAEAVKIKEILSANQEYPVKLEQLHAETDLVTKITRSDYEAECSDIFDRLTTPIVKALEMANMSLNDIQSVELLGGGVRIPKVKKTLDDYFKQSKLEIGQHLNGDEAMALGSAFRAANLSTAFKVRKVGQSDINTFGISISLEELAIPEEVFSSGILNFFGKKNVKEENITATNKEEKWTKVAEIFPKKLTLSSKLRTVTFPFDKDILCKIAYTDPSALPEGTDSTIAVINITGISKFANEALSKNATTPKIHLSFLLDSDGVVALVKAEASSELPLATEPVVDGAINVTSLSVNATVDTSVENSTTTEGEPNSTEPTSNNNGSSNSTRSKKEFNNADQKKDTKKEKKLKKDSTIRQTLVMSENLNAIRPPRWAMTDISQSKMKLKALQLADEARKAKEAALNELEAYIYKIKNKLSDDEKELGKVSTPEQRKELELVAKDAEEWMEEANSQLTTVTDYKEKYSRISTLAEPIFFRYSELSARPAAIKKLQEGLNQLKAKIALWPEERPQITDKETDQMLELIKKAETWIETKQDEQLSISAFSKPIFESVDVPIQAKPILAMYERLLKKPKPPAEKVKVKNLENSTTTHNDTETVHVEVNKTHEEVRPDESEVKNNTNSSSEKTVDSEGTSMDEL